MLIPDVNSPAVIKACFSISVTYFKRNPTTENSNNKKRSILLQTCYCVISQSVSRAGSVRGSCQVPARDYSITFQQEPRSFEIRKNKQHKMRQKEVQEPWREENFLRCYHWRQSRTGLPQFGTEASKTRSYWCSSHSLQFTLPPKTDPLGNSELSSCFFKFQSH